MKTKKDYQDIINFNPQIFQIAEIINRAKTNELENKKIITQLNSKNSKSQIEKIEKYQDLQDLIDKRDFFNIAVIITKMKAEELRNKVPKKTYGI